ncbi:MAG: hypothetical protein R2827_16245 [Bdellovibrionales bacterium]
MWTNVHATVIMGLVVVAALLIDWGLIFANNKNYKPIFTHLIPLALLANLVTVINPVASYPVLMIFNADEFWTSIINEYSMFDFYSRPVAHIIGVFLGFLAAAWSLRQKQLGAFFIVAMLLIQTLAMGKVFNNLVIVTLVYLGSVVSENWSNLLVGFRHRQRRSVIAMGSFALLFLIFTGYYFEFLMNLGVLQQMDADKDYGQKVPVQVMDYMMANNATGSVVNTYAAGGYIGYRARGKVPVMIDGRTVILFPKEYMAKTHLLIRRSNALREFVEQNNVQYVIGFSNMGEGLFDAAYRSGEFGLDLVTGMYYLMRRGVHRFPLLSQALFNPLCIPSISTSGLIEEWQRAESLNFRFNSQLLKYLVDYKQAKNKSAMIQTNVDPNNRPMQRLSAYFAFLEKDLDLILKTYSQLTAPPRILALKLSDWLADQSMPVDAVAVLDALPDVVMYTPLEMHATRAHLIRLNERFPDLIKSTAIEHIDNSLEKYEIDENLAIEAFYSCDKPRY